MAPALAATPSGRLVRRIARRDRRLWRGVRLLGHFSPQPAAAKGLVYSPARLGGERRRELRAVGGRRPVRRGIRGVPAQLPRSRRDVLAESRDLSFVPHRRGRRRRGRYPRRYPAERTFVVGHSLGGNFALRTAARAPAARHRACQGRRRLPRASPVEHDARPRGGLWVYRHYFLRRWRRSLRAKAACFPELYDFGDLRRFPT